MLKSKAQKYENIPLPAELCEYILQILDESYTSKNGINSIAIDVLSKIALNSPTGRNPSALGITSTDIEKQLQLSRFLCDDIINTLVGATLIQYEIVGKKKYWTLTARGKQVLSLAVSKFQ